MGNSHKKIETIGDRDIYLYIKFLIEDLKNYVFLNFKDINLFLKNYNLIKD